MHLYILQQPLYKKNSFTISFFKIYTIENLLDIVKGKAVPALS
jgi:hypothetical protein